MRLDMSRVKQRSFLKNKSMMSLILLINAVVFLSTGIITPLLIQPGMIMTINDVRRPAIASDVRMIRILMGGSFGVIGLILLIIGIILLIRRNKRHREIEMLKREGTLIVAEVIACEVSHIRMGGSIGRERRHPNDHHIGGRPLYYLRCSYQGLGGETYFIT